jgi:FMN phosphatase YigB (HAD superfamily)
MKLLIFDVDGVLEKEERITKARYLAQIVAVSKKFGCSLKDAKIKYGSAKDSFPTKDPTTVYILTKLGFTRDESFNIIDGVNPKGIISANKGCTRMLRMLGPHNRIVTFSNTPKKASGKTLEILKIDKYVEKRYTSEDFSESKPSTKILRHIMQDNCFKSKDTMVIGNSITKDILPAKKLGITTVLYDPHHKNDNSDVPDYIIPNLLDLLKII